MYATFTVIGLVPFLIAIEGLLDGWRALGDNAIIGIQVRSLLGGQLPLIGLPTTGENFGTGIESSHPGPIALYVLAPFVIVFGSHVGLAAGAAFVNSAAFVGSAWAGYRRGGLFLAGLTGVSLCLLARALGPYVLIDPISSNLGTFPTIAFALLTWAVLAGDRALLPAAVLAGTFTIQSHLAYVAMGGAVAAVLIVGLVVQLLRGGERPNRKTIITAGSLGAVLWAPVVIDQLFVSGNISSIIRTFTSGDGTPGRGLSFALGRLAYALGLPPLFARSSIGLDFLNDATVLGGLVAVVVLVLVLAAGFVRIPGRPDSRSLHMFAVVLVPLLLVSLYSAAKLPDPATVKAANLRWMWCAGLLVWLGAAWIGGQAALRATDRRGRLPDLVPIILAVLILAASAVALEGHERPARDAQAFDAAEVLAGALVGQPTGNFRVRYEGGPALLTVGPGFSYDLMSGGSTVFVDAGPFTRAYGEAASYDGQAVDGTYLVAATDEGLPILPAGFEPMAETSYPVAVGSDRMIQVVLGFQAGEPVSNEVPAYCEELLAKVDVPAVEALRENTVAGLAADALAEVNFDIDAPELTEKDRVALKVLQRDRDGVVAFFRRDPGRVLDDAMLRELAIEFPEFALAFQRLSEVVASCV